MRKSQEHSVRDDQMPLLPTTSKTTTTSSTAQTESIPLAETDGLNRSYGSLASIVPTSSQSTQTHGAAAADITYSWSGIDVYGECSQPQPLWRRATAPIRRLCLCCCASATVKPKPTPRKHLLKNVCGLAQPGQVLAIMGSSGAGKTTLLNALAFRSPPGLQIAQTARRAINGRTVRADELRARCAYVQQEDLFIGNLTAREHLRFQAMLRMPRNISAAGREQRVAQVLRELSLTECQDTVIGTLGRAKGLSGGERKRLAFATEVLNDPALLLCDEPTSGLDSFMAHSLLQVLRRMAAHGKTIVLTIHQPSSELYALFDRLQLMADGQVAFLGTPDEAAAFFGEQLAAPCPANYNPADFYVQLLAVQPDREDECVQRARRVCAAYAGSEVGRQVQRQVARNERWNGAHTWRENGGGRKEGDEDAVDGCAARRKGVLGEWCRRRRRTACRATWWTQFRVILWRSWLSVLKEPMLVRVRMIQTVIIAILIGIIFYGQKLDQDGVMNMNGAVFLFLTNMTFQNVFSVINVFCAEMPVFMREHRSNLYRSDTYFLGKTIAELPLFVLIPVIFTTITYPMIGLRPDWGAFAVAVALLTLVANVSTSFGYFISCASSTISMALSIGPPIIIPFLLFGGYFLNAASVPVYFEWLSYLSWFRYGNEGLLINQWSAVADGEIDCSRLNATCPASGHVILETLNFDENNLLYDFLGLGALIAGFRFAAYVALVIRTNSNE